MNNIWKEIVKIKQYWPLIALLFVAALGASAICFHLSCHLMEWMHYFTGLLFCLFALLKLFDISGFADGFQMYDFIAKNNRYYALIYPFIELILGLSYLSFVLPLLIYSLTILLMMVGSLGVIMALKRGLDVRCACMGSILKVPLSTVTLFEDIGMGIMALIMLISLYL